MKNPSGTRVGGAVHPVALEAPSASYHLRWELLGRLERRG